MLNTLNLTVKDFKVGQEVYLVPTSSRRVGQGTYKIIEVGRRWVKLSGGHRFDPRARYNDIDNGEYSPYWCWFLSEEAYNNEMLRIKNSNKILEFIQYKSLTLEMSQKILEIIGEK